MTIGWKAKKFSFLELVDIALYQVYYQFVLKLALVMRKLGIVRRQPSHSKCVETER
jgi:hypothetical protein